ncbi:MAG: hypothetical protein MI739_06720 [Bacteroidales bacterium]|nr:hypothetical protein [Bacteroidales bacterium]
MSKNRTYNCKDVDMLLASKTIIESLRSNLSELSLVRSNWTEEYVKSTATKIDNTIETYLGLDTKKELRNASANLSAIQTPAIRDLSFLKKQLEVDFAAEKPKLKEMIKNLGFEKNFRKVQNSDQEGLIELLYAFKKGMTEELKTEIVAKGTNPQLIDSIIGYADQMSQANVSQETKKETSKAVTQEARISFNQIYTEIIGVCKIASSFYQYDALKKELFTFGKVLSNMNAPRKVEAINK